MSNKTPNDHPAKTASAPKVALLACAFVVLVLTGVLMLRHRAEAPNCSVQSGLETTTLRAEQASLTAEIAASSEEKQQGLSGRDCLAANQAMLFPYGMPGEQCFWMKDMRFAIDMIWLDEQKKVVTIKSEVAPDTYPTSFCPDKPAQFVVEVSAGMARSYGWHVGTQFDF